jgi:hemerythrin-like domain-containing protein
MENNPIQTMLDEHQIISKAGDIIQSISGLWEEDSEKFRSISIQLVTFFREYADAFHHRKEEDVLFPAIKSHPDFVLQEIIDEFEQHHEDFREYTSDILDALDEYDYERAYKEFTTYLEDLLDHIGAENDELFVLAETLMDEEELETIFFRFKDIDIELGEERKKELEAAVMSLAESV